MNYSNFTKDELIKSVKIGEIDFFELSEELRSDKGIVLEAVKESGQALQYASEKLKVMEFIYVMLQKNYKMIRIC